MLYIKDDTVPYPHGVRLSEISYLVIELSPVHLPLLWPVCHASLLSSRRRWHGNTRFRWPGSAAVRVEAFP